MPSYLCYLIISIVYRLFYLLYFSFIFYLQYCCISFSYFLPFFLLPVIFLFYFILLIYSHLIFYYLSFNIFLLFSNSLYILDLVCNSTEVRDTWVQVCIFTSRGGLAAMSHHIPSSEPLLEMNHNIPTSRPLYLGVEKAGMVVARVILGSEHKL